MKVKEIIDACKSKDWDKLGKMANFDFDQSTELKWFIEAFIETHCPDEALKKLHGISRWDMRLRYERRISIQSTLMSHSHGLISAVFMKPIDWQQLMFCEMIW